MDYLKQQQQRAWQALWDKAKSQSDETRDFVFEQVVEDGWDIQDDKVIDPLTRKGE